MNKTEDFSADPGLFAPAGKFFSKRDQKRSVREGDSVRPDHIANQVLAGEPRIDPVAKLYRSDRDGGLFICR